MTLLNALTTESKGRVLAPNPLLVARPKVQLERVMLVPNTEPPEPPAPPTPEDLMAAVAERRDREAFAELFELFGARVRSYLMRQGADRATAEDLMQDVMLTVWHRAPQFDRSKASFSTWVFTIARNRRIDKLRRARRPEIDPEDPVLVREPEDAPDDVVETKQKSIRLHAAIKALPEEQEKLLRLVYFEDKSHSVIAEELEIPLGTVKSRLRLAMSKLRAALETME